MERYTIKSFLRQTLNSLLEEFFRQKGILPDFQWKVKDRNGKVSVLPETEIDGLADAIGELNANDGLAVEQEFKQVFWMATEERIFCLIDLGKKPKFRIDLIKEFEENKIEGYFCQSMYVYLYHNELFSYTIKFMEIINTESARNFEIGPDLTAKIDEKSLENFKENVIKHYKAKGRGKKCVIDCYYKKNIDQHCYYIFHEDCVKTVLDFNEDGNGLIWRPQRNNFDNVFFFEPKTGNLWVHGGRERNCEELADLFCIYILGLPGRPTKDTTVYNLSKVKNSTFDFKTKSPIEELHIKEIVCDMGNEEEVVLKVKGREEKGLVLLEKMYAVIKSYGVDPGDVKILKIRFQVLFKEDEGVKGRKSRTREIELPNKTNVTGNDYYDNVIRQHIEKEWGFKRKLLPAKDAHEAA